MKNLMLTLALMAFSFGAMATTASSKTEVAKEQSAENVSFETCNIRIKGTYDGRQVDVTVTVEADNCAVAAGNLLKAFAGVE